MRLRMAIIRAIAALCASSLSESALAKDGAPPVVECFSTAQTRQKITQHHFVEPYPALQSARGAGQGEPISAQLCTNGESYFYEISVLRRDGRAIKVHVDAASGRVHPIHGEHSTP